MGRYVGETIRVRFRLVSDAFVTWDGWYVDDITITSVKPPTEVIFKNAFEDIR